MLKSFEELYTSLTKEIFMEQARQRLEQGQDLLTCARETAERGKPDFTLAYLLLSQAEEDLKFEVLAQAFEKRALISEEKAADFDRRFDRPFPLIKLEAQKDRTSAQQIRERKKVRRNAASLHVM